jgi:hypothetical protein
MRLATYSAMGIVGEASSIEILSDPDAFLEALKIVFGDGYVFAERSIIREMIKEKFFDLSSPASSYTINDAFRIAGRKIRNSARSI